MSEFRRRAFIYFLCVESRIRVNFGCILHYELLDLIFSFSDCLSIWKRGVKNFVFRE